MNYYRDIYLGVSPSEFSSLFVSKHVLGFTQIACSIPVF